mmetsp:Transcript_113803/g.332439  ORF Transcript_113803/g.332439 Transcript_113803/m.332439 type:complete len:162 (+) Transcript_113803:78-563(+)
MVFVWARLRAGLALAAAVALELGVSSAHAAGGPLDDVKSVVVDRINHLRSQQSLEEGPAERCRRQKELCDRNIEDKTAIMRAKAQALRAAGQDEDRCLYGNPGFTTECYALKQAKESLDMYSREKEALIRQCAIQPVSHQERARAREDLIDRLQQAHGILR